jgi:hypothetical protein
MSAIVETPALTQGYYEQAPGGPLVRTRSVSNRHVVSTTTNKVWMILMADLLYVTADGRWFWAMYGMPFDGLSIPWLAQRWAGQPLGRLLPDGAIHDHGCYWSNSLPSGPLRDAARLEIDLVFREGCDYLRPEHPKVNVLWGKAVRCGALRSKWAKVQPFYGDDLIGYYYRLGLQDQLPVVCDGLDLSPEGQALRESRMFGRSSRHVLHAPFVNGCS